MEFSGEPELKRSSAQGVNARYSGLLDKRRFSCCLPVDHRYIFFFNFFHLFLLLSNVLFPQF